jgi:hypothetical protein
MFGAMFIQSLAGFGSALIAMPLLLMVFSDKPEVARAAFAITAQFGGIYFLYQYRKEWNWRSILPIVAGSLIGIPLGVYVVVMLEKETFMLLLGIVSIAYAAYSLSGLRMPELQERWGIFFGLFSGLLHGAYNVGVPPLVMYGVSRRWKPTLFKCNTATTFFVMGLFVIGAHFQQGNVSGEVLQNVMVMIPSMYLAMFLGFSLDRFVKPKPFQIGVSLLLIILGLTLIF